MARERPARTRKATALPPPPVAAPRAADELAEAVTLSEAARLLGISTRTVHRLIVAGHLQPFYLPHSGRPRLPLDQINRIRRQTDRRAVRSEPTPLERASLARRAAGESRPGDPPARRGRDRA